MSAQWRVWGWKEWSFRRGAWGWQVCAGPLDFGRTWFGKWSVDFGRWGWASSPPGGPEESPPKE